MRISDWSSDVCSSDLAVYEQVAKDVRDFHTSALKLAQGGGLLSADQVAAFSRDRYYIPFYRVDENDDAALPFTRRGLSHQSSGIKQLKGGSQALNDPIANMLANVSRLVELGRASCRERVCQYV